MNNWQKNVSCLLSHGALLSVLRPFQSSGAGGGRKCCMAELGGAGFCRLVSDGHGNGKEAGGEEVIKEWMFFTFCKNITYICRY